MAQYSVRRQCGHTETLALYGPYAERERRMAYEATRLCRACWEAQHADSPTPTDTGDLPALTGSPKQIAWATQIRAQKLAAVADLLARSTIRDPAMAARVQAALQGQRAAAWWIDRRALPALSLLEEISRAVSVGQ